MGSLFKELNRKKLIGPHAAFVESAIQYEVVMGSVAYGVSDDTSDMDVYGFCIPPKEYVFPHLRGEIQGFGSTGPTFDQYEQHHIQDKSSRGGLGRRYDMTVYSIVKFFQLCMDNNPNMIDSLYVPQRCVLFSTAIGDLVRENRKIFLHKGAWYKLKGYAFSQIHRIKTKKPQGKRKALIDEFGFDVKFAYHVVRLMNEIEQILTEHDLDLERNREQLKAIRRGEWTVDSLDTYFAAKERELEGVYASSSLPELPDEEKIKSLLLNCLEHHYGSLDSCVVREDEAVRALREIGSVIDRVRGIIT
jgi:predicted nucleotidyltransferase